MPCEQAPSPAAGAGPLGCLLATPTSPKPGRVSAESQAPHPGCFFLTELLREESCRERVELVVQEPTGDAHTAGKGKQDGGTSPLALPEAGVWLCVLPELTSHPWEPRATITAPSVMLLRQAALSQHRRAAPARSPVPKVGFFHQAELRGFFPARHTLVLPRSRLMKSPGKVSMDGAQYQGAPISPRWRGIP